MEQFYEEIKRIREQGIKAAMCIVTDTKGSTPRKIGAKMIVREDGSVFNTIGGGSLEKEVIKNALIQIEHNKPKNYIHDLLKQHNMCCGGRMDIYIEPIMIKRKLYIFGAGHTGEALAKIMVNLDFDVFLLDDRSKFIDKIEIKGINKQKVKFNKILNSLPFDEMTYIVIMTYSHPKDRSILSYCLKKPYAYLGMIGSKRKVKMTKKMFLEGEMATAKELSKADMPMGYDINADGPEEIAISIAAKLVEVKNLGTK